MSDRTSLWYTDFAIDLVSTGVSQDVQGEIHCKTKWKVARVSEQGVLMVRVRPKRALFCLSHGPAEMAVQGILIQGADRVFHAIPARPVALDQT